MKATHVLKRPGFWGLVGLAFALANFVYLLVRPGAEDYIIIGITAQPVFVHAVAVSHLVLFAPLISWMVYFHQRARLAGKSSRVNSTGFTLGVAALGGLVVVIPLYLFPPTIVGLVLLTMVQILFLGALALVAVTLLGPTLRRALREIALAE